MTSAVSSPLPLQPRLALPAPAVVLPIAAHSDEIIAALRSQQVVIVAGETGSGKSTQLPRLCVAAGIGHRGVIGCTQPRRIAALSVSRRIAEELGVTWGREVGCKIRFDDRTARDTVIKVMTDGVLLAETRADPLLRRYEAILIDEAHERSLNVDFLIGYLRRLLPQRPDLKVVITSATINTELFAAAFNNAPVFQVSGRTFPVELRYRLPGAALDEGSEDGAGGEISYLDQAEQSVHELIREAQQGSDPHGDLLVFLPSEHDIRELRERLLGTLKGRCEVLPLMGSLSAAEQERVFRSTGERKVVLATNVAETSLTIPGIRFVIDTGLARISRFTPRTRTKRLPIEKISQSSADQRAGRAGRVRDGVCVRLYTEEDYCARPRFTDPEIKRANLAEVILRMKGLRLGALEDFPFLEPPEGRAVRAGILLLQELGALDAQQELTAVGRELARLPVDPVIGRILLQARRENVLPEALVIAAGLSIQDPRERPLEHRTKAEQAHRAFAHPNSDFLSFVVLWCSYQELIAAKRGQSALRRFCREHFLSYLRMREWCDLHAELHEVLRIPVQAPIADVREVKPFDGRYRAVHRAVLAGLLGQVGYRTDRNLYRAASSRQLCIAPGSALREGGRAESQRGAAQQSRRPRAQRDAAWVVAAEVVETSQLFARTVAPVQPSWIEELGAHLVRRSVGEPAWCPHRRAVMVQQRSALYGLVLADRRVPFSTVDPIGARELFVRAVLVDPESYQELPSAEGVAETSKKFPFVESNRQLLDKMALQLALKGQLQRQVLVDRLVQFYCEKLPPIAALGDLQRLVRARSAAEPDFLCATREDFASVAPSVESDHAFPDQLEVAGEQIQVRYRYAPGSAEDGVTLQVPQSLAQRLPVELLAGAIPGLREQQLLHLLLGLPKPYRSQIDDFGATARALAADPAFEQLPLREAVQAGLQRQLNLVVPRPVLDGVALPTHLQPRVVLADSAGSAARAESAAPAVVPAWEQARARWEQADLSGWEWQDLPEEIEVARVAGVPVYLYLALRVEDGRVALRLVEDRAAAISASRHGMDALLRQALARELQEVQKQSRTASQLKPLLTLFCTVEQIATSVYVAAERHLLEREQGYPLRADDVSAACARARARMPNLVPRLLEWSRSVLLARRAALEVKRPYPGMRADLDALVPGNFLEVTPFEQLQHLPRFLKALVVRSERFDNNPARDQQRAAQLAPYRALLERAGEAKLPANFRWLLEEFKVSLFAQELGTALPISAARLDKILGN